MTNLTAFAADLVKSVTPKVGLEPPREALRLPEIAPLTHRLRFELAVIALPLQPDASGAEVEGDAVVFEEVGTDAWNAGEDALGL